jgi:hypothetical protein
MALNKKTNVNFFFQQDGAQLHLGHEVQNALKFVFLNSGQEEANTIAPSTSRCLTKGLFSVGIYNKISFTQRKSEIYIICQIN